MKTVEIRTIGDDRYHYTSGYYTDNKWVNQDTVILKRSEKQTLGYGNINEETESELVLLSLKDNSMEVLCREDVYASTYLVKGDKVYYSDRKSVKVLDLVTKECRTLYTNSYYTEDPEVHIMGISIPNDGRYLGFYVEAKDVPSVFVTVDAETGEEREVFDFSFKKPFQRANHGMICPTDQDLMFFCHEGTTEYISNRLWLHDARTGRNWNIARQRLDDNGNLGDCFGHEMWAPDGKGMYFVKYPQSPIPPRGLCYVDIETGESKVLYSGYAYWHVGVSQDGKYLTADTMCGNFKGTDECEVVVVDLENQSEHVVAIAHSNGKHPCHPHPQMSPDNRKVVYTSLDEKGRTVVQVAFLQ